MTTVQITILIAGLTMTVCSGFVLRSANRSFKKTNVPTIGRNFLFSSLLTLGATLIMLSIWAPWDRPVYRPYDLCELEDIDIVGVTSSILVTPTIRIAVISRASGKLGALLHSAP